MYEYDCSESDDYFGTPGFNPNGSESDDCFGDNPQSREPAPSENKVKAPPERLTFESSKEKFPFLENLQLRGNNSNVQVEIADFTTLSSQRPSTLEDYTIHSGFEEHELFVLTPNEELQPINIHLGQTIIYQARNVNPWEDRDDVDETGESIEEALARYISPVKAVVLHSWGRTRFGKDLRNMSGDNFEVVTIAFFPENNTQSC